MKIYIYECPDSPPCNRFIGRILVKGGFLPCLAAASTRERVEEKLNGLWERSTEAKLRKKGQLHPVETDVDHVEPSAAPVPDIELDLGL